MTRTFQLIALPLTACAGLLMSCASARHDPPPDAARMPVWPSPPDEPRITYIRSITVPSDVGRSQSRWKRVVTFITGTASERDALIKPFGVALDDAANLCVTDTGNNSVCHFDFVRKKWRRWDSVGKIRLESPVAVARTNGIFYVADSELGRVFGFDERGRETLTISTPLLRPAGLAIVGDSLVVADSQAHEVFVFDLRGQLRFQFGKRGSAAGEFNFPTHVATDAVGHLLVTDSLNSRVQVFDAAGKFISQIGSSGDAPGHFGRPKGVAVDSFGHVYVVDAVYDNIQVFDLSGQLLLGLGGGGARPGEFGVPAGIAISTDNQIYVADSYNHRVQVFKYIGKP
jgi:DNA-binding beta-propeller fold protein YncE